MLEGEGPTSADAGVASCLLLMLNPCSDVFATIFFGKIFAVGMRRLGGIELQKGAPWECSLNSGAFAAQTVNWNFAIEKRRDTWSNQTTLQRQGFRMVTVGTKTKLENFSAATGAAKSTHCSLNLGSTKAQASKATLSQTLAKGCSRILAALDTKH